MELLLPAPPTRGGEEDQQEFLVPPKPPPAAEKEPESDVERVYAFRDAMTRGAIEKGFDVYLLSEFLLCGSDMPLTSDFEARLLSLNIDPSEKIAAWITGHFLVDGHEGSTLTDVRGLLDYLQLTPEAEEMSVLSALNERLCQGANRVGMTTKEELCAFLTCRMDCLSSASPEDHGTVVDAEKLLEKAKALASRVQDEDEDEAWERVDSDEFWAALRFVDPEIALEAAIVNLVEHNYANEDASIDVARLLQDLRLWPGVVEQENWRENAEIMREKLCTCAQRKGIDTKEQLCALFADEQGLPKMMTVRDFLQVCKQALDLDIASPRPEMQGGDEQEDDDDSDSEQEGLVGFVSTFVVASDDTKEELVDVGDLLWKILLWPGAEEEHRALVAGRALRQDLILAAEKKRIETVGDLWSYIMDCCLAAENATKVPMTQLVAVFKNDFDIQDIPDLDIYLSHFLDQDSQQDAGANGMVDLNSLLEHLELFHHDDDDDATVVA